MHRVALVINTDKPQAVKTGRAIIQWLEARSIQPVLLPEGAGKLHRPDLVLPDGAPWDGIGLMVVLGGDGTLIRAAQVAAPRQIPMLGVNTGHLGFLTEIEGSELFVHLEQFLAGNVIIEERMMLTASIERDGQTKFAGTALNDAVISKGPRARMVHLEVSVGQTPVARYPADGVIIATPTGSTAYSLSAGGPIIGPTVDVLVVTPICPHTMTTRPMVFSGSEQVTVKVVENPGEVGLSTDGSDPIPLNAGDLVKISRAPYMVKLVRRHSYRFYEVLRQKLANPWR